MAPTPPILPARERLIHAGHLIELHPGEDGMVCARAVDIAGCISQGRDRAEALANIREAIDVSLPAPSPGIQKAAPAMLVLDRTAKPDPLDPDRGDAYESAAFPSLVVANVTSADEVVYAFSGDIKTCRKRDFAYLVAGMALAPTGRFVRHQDAAGPPAPVGPAVKPGSFHEGVLVGRAEALDPPDGGLMEAEHRLLARTFGPILQMIRERHHVKLGQLARALGCQTAALSAFELGERPGDPRRPSTSDWDRTLDRSMHPAGRCTCGGDRTCAWCKMDEARGYEDPPAQQTVMRLSGQETSWYVAHKAGFVDYANADYFVEAGERYRVHNGRFETAPAGSAPPADNVATETARNILAPLLARAAWLSDTQRVESKRLASASYARFLAAIDAALKEPEALGALKLHAEGIDDTRAKLALAKVQCESQADCIMDQNERIDALNQQAQEAVQILDTAADLTDPQHLQEAIKQAADLLRKPAD